MTKKMTSHAWMGDGVVGECRREAMQEVGGQNRHM